MGAKKMKYIKKQFLLKYISIIRVHKIKIYITFIVVCILSICKAMMGTYAGGVTDAIASKVIRFHVVANSDTTEDQLLKQQVRDEVMAYMEPILRDAKSVDETRLLIKNNAGEIQELAEGVVVKWRKDYPIYVGLDYSNFPTKAYGDVVLPAGEYEACRIIIGEGKGENWWCVMFPPLCYVDAANGVVPLEGKEQLEKELNEEQYKLIVNKDNKPYQIRFKIVDEINAHFHKSDYKNTPKIKK